MSDIWYYADGDTGEVGPFTLRELKEALAALSNAKDGNYSPLCGGMTRV
jgi:hypothetical protein